jgi:hypothetical protein
MVPRTASGLASGGAAPRVTLRPTPGAAPGAATAPTPSGASALASASANALDALASRGKGPLTQQWLEAAGIASVSVSRGRVVSSDLLRRRKNALGANAELSYDQPLHLVRGEGVWVYTSDAERLLDVYNNVPHVGHAHPTVVAAIANQAKRIASNTRYLDLRIIEYVERLTATLPPDLDACLFVNSGSEANDIAWRMAKSHTGHEGALVMKYAYHGITDAVTALSPAICGNVPPHVEQLAAPAANTVTAAAETDVTAALTRLDTRGFKPAALMIDSALTSTGIFDPPPAWIAPIAAGIRKGGGPDHRRRSSVWPWPVWLPLLGLHSTRLSPRHRHARETSGKWLSARRGHNTPIDIGEISTRHGLLLHLRRKPSGGSSGFGGVGRSRERAPC